MSTTAALPNRSTGFTCLACHVIFPTSERQRNHYRTDWHKYNLKRKIAALAPVSAEQFAQKVLLQQEKNRQELECQALIYECVTCRKTFYSENAYQNHMQSKKHRETYIKQQILKSNSPAHIHKPDTKLAPFFSDHSDLDSDNDSTLDAASAPPRSKDALAVCLFCTYPSPDFDMNMEHMSKEHGFFVPDIEYLVDLRGLVSYLLQKIEEDYYCLYCNGRGKEWRSAQAARAHMLDKGHCKMAFDDSEDPEALLQFYDYEPLQETEPYSIVNETDLVLRDGTRLGHRRNLRFFKQRLRKNREKQVDRTKAIEEAKAFAEEQGLTRRERRNLLAVTDGRKGFNPDNYNSAIGIRETIARQDFQRQVAVKHNLVATLRAKSQVPK